MRQKGKDATARRKIEDVAGGAEIGYLSASECQDIHNFPHHLFL
jgi:ribosomal protein L32E